jgi:hypothetical protein
MGKHTWNIWLKNGGCLQVTADRLIADSDGATFYRNEKLPDGEQSSWDDYFVGFIPSERIFSIAVVNEGDVFIQIEDAK